MNKYIFVLILAISSFMMSCYEDTAEFKTRLVSRTDISTTAGFGWFEGKVTSYNFDTQMIPLLTTAFKSNKHSFLFFAAPACDCDSLQNVFPNIMRILDTMSVQEANYQIYAMENEKKDHPYSSVLTLVRLPSIFLMVNGSPVYSINDTLRMNANGRSIEQVMLDALNMYQ